MIHRIRSIRLRATLLMGALVIGVIAAYGALTYHELRDASVATASDRLHRAADQVAAILRGSVNGMINEARDLARDPGVVTYVEGEGMLGREAALEVLGRAEAGPVVATELVGPGRLLLSAGSLPEGIEVDPGAILELAGPGVASAVGPLERSSAGIIYPAISRVTAAGSEPAYIVRWRRLETAGESRAQVESLIGRGAELYLTNVRDDLWTDLNEEVPPLPLDVAGTEPVVRYRRGPGGESMAAMAAVAGSPWSVVVAMPLSAILADARATLEWLSLFGALVLGVGAWAAWMMSGRLTASVAELADAAAALSRGEYDRRTSVDGTGEVGTLGRAFNTMAESISAAHDALNQKVNELAAMQLENRETRDRLQRVVSSSRTIIYTLEFRGDGLELAWISDNVSWLLGYSPEEALAADWWWNHLHPSDRDLPTQPSSPGQARNLTREYRFRHADGGYRWIRDQQRVVSDGGSDTAEIVGTLSDVTEQRELELAKNAAESANLAKSRFLSRMSHELRTPMNAILGFAQLLELEVPGDQNQESIRQILRAGRHLLQLIDEVLDLARMEEGGMALSVEPVEISAIVDESVELVEGMANQRGVTIDAQCNDSFVLADQQRLKQVILNLLSNAIKYNRKGGSVRVYSTPAADDWTRLSVTDTGRGISPALVDRMFRPFDRLDADRTRIEGTGLGLTLSKGLVEAMGGKLGFESAPGAGSTFWVELPASIGPTTDAFESAPAHAAPIALDDRTRLILYIEDNVSNLQLVERLLARTENLRIIPAMQGRIGLDLAREHTPDLILLDVHLPDMRGDQLLTELRLDPALRDIPVVVISADATKKQIERLLSAGASEYVTKPFDVSRLLDVIVAMLGADKREVV